MEGEEDLLSDLIEYRKSKDKGVTTAARGLLQLFREVNPGLLKRRERGKAAALGLLDGQAPAYGHAQEAAEGIDGLDLLDEHFAQARAEEGLDPDAPLNEEEQEARDAEAWQKWEEDEDDSDADSDSSGWIEVSSDEENEIEFSDSDDDEQDKAKRTKRGKKGGKKDVEVDVEDKVEDVEMDDTKSVVSEAAPSVAGTEAEMKKISLLAQQKASHRCRFDLVGPRC
jgi:protein SDA1